MHAWQVRMRVHMHACMHAWARACTCACMRRQPRALSVAPAMLHAGPSQPTACPSLRRPSRPSSGRPSLLRSCPRGSLSPCTGALACSCSPAPQRVRTQVQGSPAAPACIWPHPHSSCAAPAACLAPSPAPQAAPGRPERRAAGAAAVHPRRAVHDARAEQRRAAVGGRVVRAAWPEPAAARCSPLQHRMRGGWRMRPCSWRPPCSGPAPAASSLAFTALCCSASAAPVAHAGSYSSLTASRLALRASALTRVRYSQPRRQRQRLGCVHPRGRGGFRHLDPVPSALRGLHQSETSSARRVCGSESPAHSATPPAQAPLACLAT